jgi:hypothetical protein
MGLFGGYMYRQQKHVNGGIIIPFGIFSWPLNYTWRSFSFKWPILCYFNGGLFQLGGITGPPLVINGSSSSSVEIVQNLNVDLITSFHFFFKGLNACAQPLIIHPLKVSRRKAENIRHTHTQKMFDG